jgi:hypothetical protein
MVSMVLTSISLLIPAFALGPAPPVVAVGLLGWANAPLPTLYTGFPSFGHPLEPPYVVGARSLDQ